jgi:hypothetical protein
MDMLLVLVFCEITTSADLLTGIAWPEAWSFAQIAWSHSMIASAPGGILSSALQEAGLMDLAAKGLPAPPELDWRLVSHVPGQG